MRCRPGVGRATGRRDSHSGEIPRCVKVLTTQEPLLLAPFALAIDQQDRIWVTNIGGYVTRFPASDPGKIETFKAGLSGSGLGVDSLGNVWITNKLGSSERGRLKLREQRVPSPRCAACSGSTRA